MNSKKIGNLGERIALEYINKKNWKVIVSNYRRKNDEIDIIAQSVDKTLVFIEVKTLLIKQLSPLDALMPEDNMSPGKFHKMARTCAFFAAQHPEFMVDDRGWRIDLIAIALEPASEGRVRIRTINHYENISR